MNSKTPWVNEYFGKYKYERALAAGVEFDPEVNYSKESSYNEVVSSSNLVNNVEDYTSNNTKNNVIRNYVNSLITRNNDETEYETNLKNNLQNVSETNQENKLVFSAIGAKDLENIKINQSNNEIVNICSALDSFTQDVKKIANESVTSSEGDKTTDSSTSSESKTSDKTSQGASSSQENVQETGQETSQENAVDNFKKYERALIAGVTSHPTLNIGITESEQISKTYTNEENSKINSVLNNSETNDIISNSYDTLVETVKKVNQIVNKETSNINESRTNQSNDLVINFDGASNLKNIEITQINESLKTVKAAMIISDIMSSEIDDTTKAIVLDMIGATANFTNANISENETEQTTTSEQSTSQTTTQITTQTNKITTVSSTIIGIVFLIIAFILIKKFVLGGGIGGIKNMPFHPLYFPYKLPVPSEALKTITK